MVKSVVPTPACIGGGSSVLLGRVCRLVRQGSPFVCTVIGVRGRESEAVSHCPELRRCTASRVGRLLGELVTVSIRCHGIISVQFEWTQGSKWGFNAFQIVIRMADCASIFLYSLYSYRLVVILGRQASKYIYTFELCCSNSSARLEKGEREKRK